MESVYQKGFYEILRHDNGSRGDYIVVNNRKSEREGFGNSHTHIKSIKKGKYLIDLVEKGKINNGLSLYLLESLVRISEDVVYRNKVKKLIQTKKNKGKRLGYRNQQLGIMN